MEREREFEFTREDFDYLRNIVTTTTGIVSPDEKYTMYYSRLARRLRALGLSSFTEYRRYLKDNQDSESIELVNAVTTNLTSFFREKHHFEFLTKTVIAEKMAKRDKRIRCWSAGCSTGEEPYSIAITLAESIPDLRNWDVRIYATDIDSNVLQKGAQAVYESSRVDGLDHGLLHKYFKKGTGHNQGKVKVAPELTALIEFQQLNLLHSWPLRESMDFIFCRNVVIYFDKPTKNKLTERFGDQLVNNGYLFMGHSESMHKEDPRFKSLGKTVYQIAK